jgi:hypothetical protein
MKIVGEARSTGRLFRERIKDVGDIACEHAPAYGESAGTGKERALISALSAKLRDQRECCERLPTTSLKAYNQYFADVSLVLEISHAIHPIFAMESAGLG